MLDDRQSLERHVESLLKSFGDLSIDFGKLEKDQEYAGKSRDRLEQELISTRKDLHQAIKDIKDKMEKEFIATNKKIDDQTASKRWSPSQYALIIVSSIGGLTTIITAVLTRAPG